MSGVRHSTEISLQRETSDSEDDANQTVYGIFAGEQSDETDVKSDNLEEFLDQIGTFRAYLTHLQRKRDMLALPAPEDILQITHGETQSKDNVDFQENRKLDPVSPKKAKRIQKVVRYKV